MRLNELGKLMSIAGDKSRLSILCILFNKEKVCVSDIAKDLDMSVATASHHLRVMSKKSLVIPVREGKKICYELPKKAFTRDLKKFICKYK